MPRLKDTTNYSALYDAAVAEATRKAGEQGHAVYVVERRAPIDEKGRCPLSYIATSDLEVFDTVRHVAKPANAAE